MKVVIIFNGSMVSIPSCNMMSLYNAGKCDPNYFVQVKTVYIIGHYEGHGIIINSVTLFSIPCMFKVMFDSRPGLQL